MKSNDETAVGRFNGIRVLSRDIKYATHQFALLGLAIAESDLLNEIRSQPKRLMRHLKF